mmetsp:Transcript_8703/g.13489  ORF Transcript_8703/g.13489 Transcript_8703/m.13489 type:complete len:121 (+) Transcript_8703:79-441(+)
MRDNEQEDHVKNKNRFHKSKTSKSKDDDDPNEPEPWGIYMKVKPDIFNNFTVHDLPDETFEPPSTPKGKLRNQISFMTIELNYAIKNKLINRLNILLKQAYFLAPSELEPLICHAELIIK